METRNNILQALDHISLAEIFSYLNTSDVLLHLSLTCKAFHLIVTTSPYIIKSLFENLFGRKITKKDMSNLSFPRFQGILKDIFVANTLQEPLPFFGFRSNSGCDENNYNFLFDKIFEPRENRSIVCTDTGENFDIEGVLSEDFGRETKVLEDLVLSIDQAEIPHASLFKTWLMRYGFEAIELFPLPPNNLLEDKIKPLREFRQEFSNTLFGRNDTYHIELQCQKMMKSIGLIQSCHLSRDIDSMTCPVKTLAAFASLNEEIRSSQIAYLFNDCKTSDDLIQLLKEHKDDLPDIAQTSIKRLAELSPNIQYQDEEEDEVEFVVFSSNGKKRDAIPLFWVNFAKAINKNLFLNFRDCNFSGRNVMLKLIRCEDLKEKFGDTHFGTNIDIKFCSFFGPVIDL